MEDCFMSGKGLNLEFPDFKLLGNASKRKVDTAWSIIPISKWLTTTVIASLLTRGTKFNHQIHLITQKNLRKLTKTRFETTSVQGQIVENPNQVKGRSQVHRIFVPNPREKSNGW